MFRWRRGRTAVSGVGGVNGNASCGRGQTGCALRQHGCNCHDERMPDVLVHGLRRVPAGGGRSLSHSSALQRTIGSKLLIFIYFHLATSPARRASRARSSTMARSRSPMGVARSHDAMMCSISSRGRPPARSVMYASSACANVGIAAARSRSAIGSMPRWRFRTFSKAMSRASDRLTTGHGPRPKAEVAPLAVNRQALNPGAGISDDVEVQSIASVGMTAGLYRLQGGCLECDVPFSLVRDYYQMRRTPAEFGGRCNSLADGHKLKRHHQVARETPERSATWKNGARFSRERGSPEESMHHVKFHPGGRRARRCLRICARGEQSIPVTGDGGAAISSRR